jgi:hypothetical protein
VVARQNPTGVTEVPSEAKVGDPEGIKQIDSVVAAATALDVEIVAAEAGEGGGAHRKVCSVGR